MILIALAVTVGLLLVVRGTIRKTRWGINPDQIACPRCRALLPRTRKPQNLRQILWGGTTCPTCGTESDKWGRELPLQ